MAMRLGWALSAAWMFWCAGLKIWAGDVNPWQQGDGYRFRKLADAGQGSAGLTRLGGDQSGLRWTNAIARERYTTNQIYLNGSGVAAGDVDEDGRVDLFLGGLAGASRLFRNEGGFRFVERRDAVLTRFMPWDVTGVALADLDGDGHLDLVVNSVGEGTRIFWGDGKLGWAEGPLLNGRRCGASLGIADMDGDGDLDLYITNYRIQTVRDDPTAKYRVVNEGGKSQLLEYNGISVHTPEMEGRFTLNAQGKVVENGEPDLLVRNLGGRRFEEVGLTGGDFRDEAGEILRTPLYDWGLSVMFRDINGDQKPDLYVCNDFDSPDRIWINQGGGQFRMLPGWQLRHTSLFSMGMDVADVDRDGRDDFLVVDMMSRGHWGYHVQRAGVPPYEALSSRNGERLQVSRNTLWMGRGDGSWVDTAWWSGIQASEWSWSPVFLDVDLDGFEDVLITNGHERDAMNGDVIEQGQARMAAGQTSAREKLELNNKFQRFDSPNAAFRNLGRGRFEDAGERWGFATPSVSHGICLADLDGDGDLDVVVNALNQEVLLYRNNAVGGRVAVRLKGLKGNTRGVGVRVEVQGGAVPLQSQVIVSGGRYLSSDDAVRVFACGAAEKVRVGLKQWDRPDRWVGDLAANQEYEIDLDTRAGEGLEGGRQAVARVSLLTKVDLLGGHGHVDEPFLDFQRQPLMPWKLSQLGPGVCWHDWNKDGWMDLAVGGGRGGRLALFLNDGRGGFVRQTNASLMRVLGRDLSGLVAWDSALIAGSANYEDGTTNGGAIRILDVNRGQSGEAVLGPRSSTGPLSMADVDGDGVLDLFVGGRVIAGRYPEAADNLLLRQEKGRFVRVQKWENFGLTSGSVFSDLDGDGDPDLVVACEWGAIRFLRNEGGKLEEWDPEMRWVGETQERPGRASLMQGLWRGVTTGDWDEDGLQDVVVSNLGLNTFYSAGVKTPYRIYHGDLAGAGMVDLVESRVEGDREWPQRSWRLVRSAFPFLMEKVNSYDAYARQDVGEIYGDRLQILGRLDVRILESVVLLNRKTHFEVRVLPVEAQWLPAHGVVVADWDGDGHEDLFLSQNQHGMNPELERYDGGEGLVLLGDGRGGFRALDPVEAGVHSHGDQRGCGVADFDNDGRPDLVVAQNSGLTEVYRNTGGVRGLRVVLRGSRGNEAAVGAWLRLNHARGKNPGPVRELHVGSGYWSTDSTTMVLGRGGDVKSLWVRWPDGKQETIEIRSETEEVVLSRETGERILRP